MGYLKCPPRSIQVISHSIQCIFHPSNTRINFITHSSQSVIELDVSTMCMHAEEGLCLYLHREDTCMECVCTYFFVIHLCALKG